MDTFLEWLKQELLYNFANTSPRYVQLSNAIEKAIQNNILQHNDFIPPERSLAEHLNLSRVTVSKAFQVLAQKNLIDRTQGRGTKVIGKYLNYALDEPKGFTAQARSQGYDVQNIWLAQKIIPATTNIIKELALRDNLDVAYLHRIRCLAQTPVSVETTWIPQAFLSSPTEIKHSLYEFWRTKGIFPHKIEYHIQAVKSSNSISQLLHIENGYPLLLIKQRTFDINGIIIEYSESFCRTDLYEFKITT